MQSQAKVIKNETIILVLTVDTELGLNNYHLIKAHFYTSISLNLSLSLSLSLFHFLY